MLVHFGLDNLAVEWESSWVCIGTFDGVHLGHQQLIHQTVREARDVECASVVLTFDRHPLSILNPENAPPAIGTLEQNVILLREQGVSACVILPFDEKLVHVTADHFLKEIMMGMLKAKGVVVGHDFAFGHKRQGTGAWLASQISTHVVEPFLIDGARVSSTVIRNAISEGNVSSARKYLGRPFRLAGVVVPGKKVGRTIGYPTANLARSSKTCVPANGIYAGRCKTKFGWFAAAISVGSNPTVGGIKRTVEAYLLDYPGESLYSDPIEIEFLERIRGEEKFDSVEKLVEKIDDDVSKIRMISNDFSN